MSTNDFFGNVESTDPVFGSSLGKTILQTHPPEKCAGQNCVVHNPSEHPLNAAPILWRADRGLMERTCPHGVGHPDPDDLAHKRRILGDRYQNYAFDRHGCDGCCQGRNL